MRNSEYNNSKLISINLTQKIINQNETHQDTDVPEPRQTRQKIKTERDKNHKTTLEQVKSNITKDEKLANELAQMKGSSAWLTTLPSKQEKFVLNKREFFDDVAIRYRWNLKRLPVNYPWGKKLSLDHAVSCITGGFIHRRHDNLRDTFACLLELISTEVSTEPILQPLTGEKLPSGSNVSEEARLDIKTRGFWQQYEMAFFNIRETAVLI